MMAEMRGSTDWTDWSTDCIKLRDGGFRFADEIRY